MAENPLIGKTISLISKKNIRYKGTLYSINEQNATVALQSVTSFGTEGREEAGKFVGPSDAVHPFLLFRGQDIKDLHVHEEPTTIIEENAAAPTPPAVVESTDQSHNASQPTAAFPPPPAAPAPILPVPAAAESKKSNFPQTTATAKDTEGKATDRALAQSTMPAERAPKIPTAGTAGSETPTTAANAGAAANGEEPAAQAAAALSSPRSEQPNQNNSSNSRGGRERDHAGRRGRGGGRGRAGTKGDAAPGTGASLLNRTTRGTKSTDKADPSSFQNDFDFQSNLQEFQKENTDTSFVHDTGDEGGDTPVAEDSLPGGTPYDKDDFFDNISSDATDRAAGIDNRLRGRQERSLNTETFGAVALNSDFRRRGGRGNGGRGRGPEGRGASGRGRNGGGRGRGRGRGRTSNGERGGGANGGGRGRGGYRNSTGRPEADETTT